MERKKGCIIQKNNYKKNRRNIETYKELSINNMTINQLYERIF